MSIIPKLLIRQYKILKVWQRTKNLWQQYCMFELSEVMRQKEDKDFPEILNLIREGKRTEADIGVLRERILKLSQEHPDYPINSTHFFLY